MSRRIETIVSEIELILKQILDDDHYGEDWIELSFECSRMIDFWDWNLHLSSSIYSIFDLISIDTRVLMLL